MGKTELIDYKKFKTLLDVQLVELENLSKISRDSRNIVELDQQSIGRLSRQDALQQQAMAKAQEINRRRQMDRLTSALKKIEADEYGICEVCSEEIPEGRLLIDASSETCVNCKN